jgi:hypothetical protein
MVARLAMAAHRATVARQATAASFRGSADGGAAAGGEAAGGEAAGGAPGTGGAGGAALAAYMEDCEEDADCETGMCHLFNGQGVTICTQACEGNGDCPAPSAGCNNMGLCRPPA